MRATGATLAPSIPPDSLKAPTSVPDMAEEPTSAVPASASPGPCRVLTCEVAPDGALRLCAYDVEAGQALRAVLRKGLDGTWFVEGRPRLVGSGGPCGRAEFEARAETALLAWAQANEAAAAAALDRAAEEARGRPRAVDEGRAKRARWHRRQADTQDRHALTFAASLRERVARTLDGFPLSYEMTHRGTRYAVTVSENEPLLRIEGGTDGPVAVRWDGLAEGRGGPSLPGQAVRALAQQAAKRRGDPLAPLIRLLKARWDALSHRIEADKLDGFQTLAAVPDRPVPLPVEPAHARIAWHSVTALSGDRLQVCLHDLHGVRQVNALVEPVDGTWATHEAMSALSFRTGRREELRDPAIAAEVLRIALGPAADGPPPTPAPSAAQVEEEAVRENRNEAWSAPSVGEADSPESPYRQEGTPLVVTETAAEPGNASDRPQAPEPDRDPLPGTPAPELDPEEPEADELAPVGSEDEERPESDGDPLGWEEPGPVASSPPLVAGPELPAAASASLTASREAGSHADLPAPPPPAVPFGPDAAAAIPRPIEPEEVPAIFADWVDAAELDDPERDAGMRDEPEYDAFLDDDDQPSTEDLAALDSLFADRPASPARDPAENQGVAQMRFFVARADRLRASGWPYPVFPYRETIRSPLSSRAVEVRVALEPNLAIALSPLGEFVHEDRPHFPEIRYNIKGKAVGINADMDRLLCNNGWRTWFDLFRRDADAVAQELLEGRLGIAIRGEKSRIALAQIGLPQRAA